MSECKNRVDKSGHLFGNFSSYYSFHPAQSRVDQFVPGCFPKIWEAIGRPSNFYLLDIGCNDGTLSLALLDHVETELTSYISKNHLGSVSRLDIHMLGIDVDGDLIQRANAVMPADVGQSSATLTVRKHSKFLCFDVMDCTLNDCGANSSSPDPISAYLKANGSSGFHFISLFSVTMWVHLNYGDAGLLRLYGIVLYLLQKRSLGSDGDSMHLLGSVLVEPQPLKCYRTAKKRCKSNNLPLPPFSGSIVIKDSVRHAQDFFAAIQAPFPTESPPHFPSSNPSAATVPAVTERCVTLENESCWGRSMLLFSVYTTTRIVSDYISTQDYSHFGRYSAVCSVSGVGEVQSRKSGQCDDDIAKKQKTSR